jgi:hypothetical protein
LLLLFTGIGVAILYAVWVLINLSDLLGGIFLAAASALLAGLALWLFLVGMRGGDPTPSPPPQPSNGNKDHPAERQSPHLVREHRYYYQCCCPPHFYYYDNYW